MIGQKFVAAGAAFIILMLVSGSIGFAAGAAGWVQEAKGKVTVISQGKVLSAKVGTPLQTQDSVKTGANSRVQIMFKDKTTLALAADSECRIGDVFLEKPDKSLVALTLEFIRGTFDVLAGGVAKMNPERFHIRTPMVSLGVRGTEFASAVDRGSELHGLYEGGPVVVTRLGAKATKPAAVSPRVSPAQLCEQIEKTMDAAEKAYRDYRIAKMYDQSKIWDAKVDEYKKLASQYSCK